MWRERIREKIRSLLTVKRLLPLILALGFVFFILVLWQVPKWQLASLKDDLGPKALIELENDSRATLAQILGGALVLISLYFAWQTVQSARKTVELTHEGQVTDRFSRAVEQLGNKSLEIRLGGIYALERIAKDSERDHWPIMEVLTAYVREKAPWRGQAPKNQQTSLEIANDIQAIMTVLGRRKWTYRWGEELPLNLAKTDLHGADLTGANLEGADLRQSNLEGVFLSEAKLGRAYLKGANLKGVRLYGAKAKPVTYHRYFWLDLMYGTRGLAKYYSESVDFNNARLEEADLTGANLVKAVLIGADLEKAVLVDANLEGADLREANLRCANLLNANLKGADLTETESLTQEQIKVANGDTKTRLPWRLQKPEHWLST